jgi:SPP1 gp7 family putative phage head morphogenesis protein
MALTKNPTRTRTIEKNWLREVNRRWAEFKKVTVDELRRLNKLASITNAEEIFALEPSQQRTYMAFLERQIQELLIVTPEAPNWQAVYQLQSYERGVESIRRSLISQGAGIVPTASETLVSQGLTVFTATPSIGSAAAIAPIHADSLEFLYSRSYKKLKGWADAMATETRQILFDGVSQGKGINTVVREMVARQDVSRTRARVIARTETIQAYQHSTANETERSAEEIDEEILLRWLTVRDSLVRHLHATFHGVLMTPKEYRRRIGLSPWNCRCGSSSVLPEFDTTKKKDKFKKERSELLELESK